MKIKIELNIGDKKQFAEGSSVKSAMYKLKKPDKISAVGNIRLYKDNELIKQFPMNLARLKRLFSVKFSFKDIFIKNLENFIK